MKILRRSKEDFERLFQNAEAKIASLEKAVETGRLENEELRQQMIASHKNVCNLSETSSDVAKESSRMKQELAQLQRRLLDAERECRDHQTKGDRLSEDNKALNLELSSSRKKREELENELKSLRNELEELRGKMKELQSLHKANETRESKLNEELSTSEKKANEAANNYEVCSKTKKALEGEFSVLKQQLTEMKYQVETLEIEKKEKRLLQAKLETVEQKYKELLKRETSEQSNVENLNEALKEENLQLHVDLGREKGAKETLEIKFREMERNVEKVS